jgi:hypothetical protein
MKRKSKSRPGPAVRAAAPGLKPGVRSQLCSAWELDSTSFAWDNRWGMPLEAAAVGAFAGDDVMRAPTSAIFQQARRWSRLVSFIGTVQQLRVGFYNFGLLGALERPVNPKKPDGQKEWEWHPGIRAVNAKDQEKISRWKEKNAAEIQRVVLDIWRERMITRNVVCLWRNQGRLLVKPPEACTFKDEFGIEKLSLKHDLTSTQIDSMAGLSPAEKLALKRGGDNVELTHDDRLFHFAVLRDESVGMGFGWPDLVRVFHACCLEESLLVGDRQLADVCRVVYEQHLLGHEIKSGLHAGAPTHFVNKTRSEGTKKQIKSKKGHVQIITNFDHEIKIGAGRPDSKQYDAARYKEVMEQLALWGVPFAQMWAGVVNPFLMSLARQVAGEERVRMNPFLSQLLQGPLGAPAPVVCQWRDDCFWDSRLLLDVLKAGLAGGPLSQESFLIGSGFDPSLERERKGVEARLGEGMTHPVFDAAHGKREPGKPGKPAGGKDES